MKQRENIKNLPNYYRLFLILVYQDVHVMMLIGFGFLMTFLQRHGFGSVAFNFLLTCYVIEWSTLVNGWFKMISNGEDKIYLNIERLVTFGARFLGARD